MEEKKPRIKILVACHKADPNIRQDDIYMPIQVGKALHPELDLGFQCDNTGDNISEKNATYCELTALYWAWKNLKDVDYIGLCHYRRYFAISEGLLIRKLESGKTIVAHEYITDTSNLVNIIRFTSFEEVYILIDTILSLHSDMRSLIVDYLYNSNRYSVFNMMVASKVVFDEYCEFLFLLLEEIDKRLFTNKYTRQRRNIGYFAEIILGLYVRYKHLCLCRVNTTGNGTDQTFKRKIRELLRLTAFKICNIPAYNDIYLYDPVIVGLNEDGIKLNSISSNFKERK